jgi:CheY-like chemotaxis protein
MEQQVKKRVMIVDDVKSNLMVLNSILNQDYSLIVARDGLEALDRANKFTPDLILLDILMPGMNGYEVIAALKNADVTKDIPVIFVTGLDDPDEEKKGLSLGAVGYLTKPFEPATVKECVHSLIG